MSHQWEPAAAAQRSPWLLVVVVLGVVVAAGLLARPGGAPGDTAQPGRPEGRLEVREADVLPGRTATGAGRTAVVHALNTASLASRRPPLQVDLDGAGRLVTAVSERGRQLLVLARESANGRTADLRVLDAATLQLVADLGRVPGPVEHLAVTGDGRAVVWLRHARDPGTSPTLYHVPIQRGAPASVPLPEGFRVREVGALRLGRVAVAGSAPTPLPGPPLVVLVLEVGVGVTAEAELDVGEDVRDGGMRWDVARAGLVWDTLRQLLHVVHATEDRMTTVRLADGEVLTSPAEGRLDGLPSRDAVLAVDGDAVIATGFVASTSGRPLPRSVPLEPLRFATDRATLSFAAGTPAVLGTRGVARPGWAIASAGGRTVLASARWGPDGAARTGVRVLDEELEPVGGGVELPGRVLAAQLNWSGSRLRIATETAASTEVAIVELPSGRVVAERVYRAGAEVHLGAAVVIERP